MKGKFAIAAALTLLLGFAASVQAVPSLGVGTGGYIPGCSSDNYIECFNGPYVSGGGDGFVINSLPEDLTVFTNITGANIWLLAEESWITAGTGLTGTVDSTDLLFGSISTFGAISSYKSPYIAVNLGQVDGTFDWYELDTPPFEPGPFYGLDVSLDYAGGGSIPEGDWIFAVADDNGLSGLQGRGSPGGIPRDSFSPKTTSAVGVPEPSTLSMLISGVALFAMGMLKRRSA